MGHIHIALAAAAILLLIGCSETTPVGDAGTDSTTQELPQLTLPTAMNMKGPNGQVDGEDRWSVALCKYQSEEDLGWSLEAPSTSECDAGGTVYLRWYRIQWTSGGRQGVNAGTGVKITSTTEGKIEVNSLGEDDIRELPEDTSITIETNAHAPITFRIHVDGPPQTITTVTLTAFEPK